MKRILIVLTSTMLMGLCPAFAQTTTTTTTPATTTTVTNTGYTVPATMEPAVPIVQFVGNYWAPKLRGHIFVSNTNQNTSLNFRSDLDIKSNRGVPGGEIIVTTTPATSIHATYLYLDDSGSNNLSRTIVYKGNAYPVSTHVESEMVVQYFSLGWLWNFINTDTFKTGLILDAKGISARSTVRAPGLGFDNSQHFTNAAPTPGLSAEVKIIDRLSLFGEITGLPAGRYGHFFDAQAGIKVNIIRNLDLSVGYRDIDVRVKYKRDSGELELPGPFAALTVKF